MLSNDFVLKLVRDLEDVRLFGELYFELARKRIASSDDLEDTRVKMRFCKEKVVAIAKNLDQQFKDFQSAAISVGNVVDALRQLGEQTRILEGAAMKRIALKAKLDALFDDYQRGKFTFFGYTEMKMRLLQGRTKEQWEQLLDGIVTASLTKIKSLNGLVLDSMQKENRFNELRVEATPVQVPDRPIVPVPIPQLIVPSPEMKIEIRQQISPTSEQASSTDPSLPAPPNPEYHEEKMHLEKLRALLHRKTEIKAEEQRPPEKIVQVEEKMEAPAAVKVELPKELGPLTEKDIEEPLPGKLAEPLDEDDPYVRWLNESDASEKEEDRIDRLISELKSQPIETEAKSKVMEELKGQLEKLKQKKTDIRPLDPGMLEESHEEYDF